MRLRVALVFSVALVGAVHGDEGMFPLSDVPRLDLRAHGLQIAPSAVYNPGGTSLVDAIVQVGTCTGSFVSPDGLLITNHHCAFGTLQAASTAERDYVTQGFLAPTRGEELRAPNLTAQIALSYTDVSAQVLAEAASVGDPGERARVIERTRNAIVLAAEKAQPGRRAEVAEMFAGRTYVLFVYAIFRDVRLVYAPPRAIGEFAGEDDNWRWPRHTGDFSFMRVYVAPDGGPAAYDAHNVPYHPKTVLKVNPRGVNEGDAVFLLGYPGRTFRHRSSHFLSFEQDVRLPYISDLYEMQIATLERAGRNDRAVSLKFDARIKSQSNVMKNYRGKLAGLRRTRLVATREREESALQAFIDADGARKARFGSLLRELAAVYLDLRTTSAQDLLLETLSTASAAFTAALTLEAGARDRERPDAERAARFMERNLAATRTALALGVSAYDRQVDRALLQERLAAALVLPGDQRLPGLEQWLAGRTLEAALEAAFTTTRMGDAATVTELFARSRDALNQVDDPLLDLARALQPAIDAAKTRTDRRQGTLARLWADFVEVKAAAQQGTFVPDANRTLRLTFGRVRGYLPQDALIALPFTTLRGVVEKTTGIPPYYDTPAALLTAAARKDYGRFASAKLGDVPVAFLYDADTTGGSSGSPVLNAKGELVGVNFDRVWEATINDFVWSPAFSRSIGVDIRYVLWVVQKVAGAQVLIDELLPGDARRLKAAS